MAKVINTSNHLEDEMNSEIERKNIHDEIVQKKSLKVLAVSVVAFLLLHSFPLAAFIAGAVGFVSFGTLAVSYLGNNSSGYDHIRSGIIGEKTALEVLSKLSDEYTIISDLEIEFDGSKSQIDSIVVGPNGIFIVETKNIKGEIKGNDTDKDIIVDKVGRRGGEYSNTVYNPCKQVGTHVFRLSKFLQERRLGTWVQGIVFFSNTETTIKMQTAKIPVFAYSSYRGSDIVNYIATYSGHSITPVVQKRIIEELSKCIM